MVDDPRELDVAGRTLLVGTGQYFATFGHVRLTVLDVGSNRPTLQWDGGVRRSMLPQIFDELDRRARAAQAGELDTMHATPWRHAWTTRASNFTLWDRISRRVWVEDERLHVRRRPSLSVSDIDRVVATLSASWHTRGVAVACRGDAMVPLARTREPMAWLDPTYDFIDVMFDAGWAVALARALADAIGVPADCSAYD